MNFLKNLFRTNKKMVVTFHMKSGENILVECEDIKIEKQANDLVGYNIFGPQRGQSFYVRLDDISAITHT